MFSSCFFQLGSPSNLSFLLPRENGRHAKNATPSKRKSNFQGARLRRRRRQGKEQTYKNHLKTASKNIGKKTSAFLFFRAARPCHENAPKITSQNPSDTLLGTPWRPQGLPRSGRERPRRVPGASQERPGSHLSGHFGPRDRPEASREPFWSHFGSIVKHVDSHFRPPGDAFSDVYDYMFPTCAQPLSPCYPRLPTQKQRKRRLKKQHKHRGHVHDIATT